MMRIIPRQRITKYKGEIKDILLGISTNRLKRGEYTKKFEKQFAKYIGTKYAVAVNSGRLALFLVLKSYNLKKGDEIILPAYNYYVIPKIIHLLNLKPVFIDVDENTFTLNPSLIQDKITPKTKAIILTHIFGQPCDMKKILPIAKKYNLRIIEDCAHALGSEYNGGKIGSFGTGIFSFEVTKHINTFGGGMIVTNNDSIYKKIKSEINMYSCPTNLQIFKKILKTCISVIITNPIIFSIFVYPPISILNIFNIGIGQEKVELEKIKIDKYKQKFSNIQALIGLKQLKQLDVLNQKRKNIERLYRTILKNDMNIQQNFKNAKPKYMLFSVRHSDRNKITKYLLWRGIDTKKDYMIDCSNIFGKKETYNNSERLSCTVFHLPFYPQLNKKGILYISKTLKSALKKFPND